MTRGHLHRGGLFLFRRISFEIVKPLHPAFFKLLLCGIILNYVLNKGNPGIVYLLKEVVFVDSVNCIEGCRADNAIVRYL